MHWCLSRGEVCPSYLAGARSFSQVSQTTRLKQVLVNEPLASQKEMEGIAPSPYH
jgi:hypothetical protein